MLIYHNFGIFRKLPESLKDGEEFGLNEKWYSFHFCDTIRKKRNENKYNLNKKIIKTEQKN